MGNCKQGVAVLKRLRIAALDRHNILAGVTSRDISHPQVVTKQIGKCVEVKRGGERKREKKKLKKKK